MQHTTIAQRYIDFLIRFGSTENQKTVQPNEMESIFAPICKKVMNGAVLTNSREEIYTQLQEATNYLNGWTINVYNENTLVNAENNVCVIHYDITTKSLGTMIVIKYLTMNQDGLIKEINEVYNQKG